MDEAAEIKDLRVDFKLHQGMVPVVEGLTFQLKPSQTVALVGESGSGKSMSSLAIMRLLPFNAYYGKTSEIFMQRMDLLNLPEFVMRQFRGKKIGMIFQEPMTALNPVKRIKDQLAEAVLREGSWTKKSLQERLLKLLEEVEMQDPLIKLNQYPHQLSGGQKQRVMIAMAIANHPEILIADEPTTALDLTIQIQILNLLKKLEQQYQMSMLLITHDLAVVKAMADEVVVMYAGEIVEKSSKDDFFKAVKHPYSQKLLNAMPSFEKRGRLLETIPGAVPSLEERPSGCRFHPRCHYVFERCKLEKPLLQKVDSNLIRCHLYPNIAVLPFLSEPTNASDEKPIKAHDLILKVENLSVEYQNSTGFLRSKIILKAVDNLSFQLCRGKTLAIVGESGSGKTTVSRALMHLIPITKGAIYYQGKEVYHMNHSALKAYRHHVQLIFQDPFSSMNPRMTVSEIIAEGMIAQKHSRFEIQKRQKILLDQVNLPLSSLNKYPHQFSGGQRQRLCIARALATKPEILICDEPTSALDISVQAQILNLLRSLQEELNIAIVFITHNMAVVAYMADEVLVMKGGVGVEKGSVAQILYSPQDPYTKKLLGSVLLI